jgi:hypothetical protein
MADETAKGTPHLSPHDQELLRELYVCFDRPAFRVPFEHEADLDALIEAIDDTIAAINTGVKRTRAGVVFGKPVGGKAYVDDRGLRAALDQIVEILGMAKLLYARARAAGYFFDMAQIGRHGIAFHSDHQEDAMRVAVMFDEERNRVIEIANGLYKGLGLPELPLIGTAEYYEKEARLPELKAQLPKRRSKFISILEVLELKPNFFGVGINLNELFQKLSKRGQVQRPTRALKRTPGGAA